MLRRTTLLGLVLCVALDARAQSPQDVSLSWVRTDGADTCIGARELAVEVERLVGHAMWVATSDAALSVEGYVTPHPDGGFAAHIVTADATGAIVGERDITTPSSDCRALDEPVSLVIALTIDPESGFIALPDMFDEDGEEHVEDLLEAAPAVDAAGAAAAAQHASTTAEPRSQVTAEGKRRDPDPLGTGLGVVATRARGPFVALAGGLGQVPKGGPGVILGLIGTRRSWPVGMEGRLWFPRREAPSETGADPYLFWSSQISLYACPVWRPSRSRTIEGHICLGVAPSLLVSSLEGRYRKATGEVQLELLLQAVFPTARRLSVLLGFTFAGVLYGQDFVTQGGVPIWTSPFIRGQVSAGLFFPR